MLGYLCGICMCRQHMLCILCAQCTDCASFAAYRLSSLELHVWQLQYVIPHLLGFDELFQYDGGVDAGQADGLGADFAGSASAEPAPVPMPTSAPF